MTRPRVYSWFLLANYLGGTSIKWAHSDGDARQQYRAAIAESFREQGLTVKQSRQAATSYQVFVIAGGIERYEEAERLARNFQFGDALEAIAAGQKYRRNPRWTVGFGHTAAA